MTSLARSLVAAALLLVTLSHAGPVLACDALEREIVDVRAEKIGGYTETGKFDRDLTRAEVLNKKVVACSDVNSALAKIMLSDKRPVWIDLTEVKLTATSCEQPDAKATPSTIASVATRPKDVTEAVTSGIGSCK